MTDIDLSLYHEQATPNADPTNECERCAFRDRIEDCAQALEHAPLVFGGDCITNNVIYIRAEQGATS